MKLFPDIDAQAAAMRINYPHLRIVSRGAENATWCGPLKPLLQTYTISVEYRVPAIFERLDLLKMQPRVRVVAPMLKPRPGDREGDLPHVYHTSNGPVLCLFNPESAEWTPCDLLAKTTIPYTINWLVCYEGWRATGLWSGGGRHPTISPLSGVTR